MKPITYCHHKAPCLWCFTKPLGWRFCEASYLWASQNPLLRCLAKILGSPKPLRALWSCSLMIFIRPLAWVLHKPLAWVLKKAPEGFTKTLLMGFAKLQLGCFMKPLLKGFTNPLVWVPHEVPYLSDFAISSAWVFCEAPYLYVSQNSLLGCFMKPQELCKGP